MSAKWWKESKFGVLGRGGLTANPADPFGGTAVLNDLSNPTASAATSARVPLPPQATSAERQPLVKAQGWVQADEGFGSPLFVRYLNSRFVTSTRGLYP